MLLCNPKTKSMIYHDTSLIFCQIEDGPVTSSIVDSYVSDLSWICVATVAIDLWCQRTTSRYPLPYQGKFLHTRNIGGPRITLFQSARSLVYQGSFSKGNSMDSSI